MVKPVSKPFNKHNLLDMFLKFCCKILLRNKTNKFLQHVSISVQQVELGLVSKSECALECICVGIVGIKIGELDLARILRFKPMNHGRHCAAGTSGKAEKFHQLQLTRC